MANEFKHKDVGGELSREEWEAIGGHEADGQLANDILYFNGTNWVRTTLTKYLDAQKIVIIPDDGSVQIGDTVGAQRFELWEFEAGAVMINLTPSAGNWNSMLGIVPSGNKDGAGIHFLNSADLDNYGCLSLEVRDQIVYFIPQMAGAGNSPVVAYCGLHWRPADADTQSLGSEAKRWLDSWVLHRQMSSAVLADHTWSGLTSPMTAGTALIIGQAVYVGGDGKMEKAKADGAATMPTIALATGTIDENASGEFLMQGYFRDNTWNWTPGKLLYVSKDTAGALTETQPAAGGEQVQRIGIAMTADILYFKPDLTVCEVA